MRNLEEIVEIFKRNGVTGYQLQRDLDISQVGADKIMDGRTKRPQKNTIKMLNQYIDNGFKPLKSDTIQVKQSDMTETDKDYIVKEVVKKLMGELEPLFEIAQMTALDVNRIRHKVDKIRKDV